MSKQRLSLYSLFACIALMLYCNLIFYPKWDRPHGENTLGWDVAGYYWYLPSLFVYKDLKQQKFGDSVIDKYGFTPSFEQSFVHESGNRVMKYSSGMALMYLPFFTAAHALAGPLGYPTDGFSLPYTFAIAMGNLLVAFIGLWYYRRLMLYYFSDKVVAALLFLLVFGTNYLNYTAIDGSLSHNWLFTVYVCILLATHRFYQRPAMKYAVAIGLLCGLAILTRPTEVICVLIPLLWGMEGISLAAIKTRLQFLWQQRKYLLAAGICTIAVASIQVIYWLYVTGAPLVYSYGDQGFSWLHPHFRDYIFSYRSGWLTYTPLVAFIFIGILPFLKYGRNKVAILVFFALNLYIVSAWDIWWYGGTGGRAMIQSYPVILFPFAALLQYIFSRKVLAWVASPVLLLFAYFNIWFTYNAHAGQGLYDSEGMTNKYYWNVIFRYKVPEEITKYKDTDELFRGTPKNITLLYKNNFESDTAAVNRTRPAIEGNVSTVINSSVVYSPTSSFPYAPGKADWLRAQAKFQGINKEWTGWKMPQFIVRFNDGERVVKERMIRVQRFLYNGDIKDLYIDVKVPGEKFDSVKIFFWNPGSERELVIDDLKVWSFDE